MVSPTVHLVLLAILPFLASTAPTTPADLHNVLSPRDDNICRDDLGTQYYCKVSDAAACINELAAKGQTACKAGLSTTFCQHESCRIIGVSVPAATGKDPTYIAQSPCQDVARGAGRIMDLCARGDGKIKGSGAAWGNGNLHLEIRHV